MNPETTIHLRQQLEAIKQFEHQNAPGRFSYPGYWLEFVLGIFLLGHLIMSRPPDAYLVIPWFQYLAGIALMCQGLYLIIRFKTDKRFHLLLEAMLSIGGSDQG